jgi:hypothetical protein
MILGQREQQVLECRILVPALGRQRKGTMQRLL